MAYNPENGEVLWETEGTTLATCGTMVWDDERVFASGGYPKAETICVKSDGSGEVVWSNNQKCYEQSMLLHEGYVYAVTDAGVAHCWRATDGETMWRKRLGGDYSSSPVLIGNSIHVFNEQGEGFVFAPNPQEYQELGRNKFADDVFPTPSVCGDTMYHRFAKRDGQRRQEYVAAIS
jgi:outer membrane protein assembly factor BamB